ncbi:MAG: DUF948 domain-containing protein [Thermodesulfovibrionia bacterium]|nr:DUF948 domain-containing protein [Thermodesulfovibrionia bacterium]
MNVEFLLGIIAGFLFFLLLFLIPAILQIKRTARAAEDLLITTRQSIAPLLADLQQTVESVNHVVLKLDESMGNMQNLTKAIGETGSIISDINGFVRKIQMVVSFTTLGFSSGIKTALGVLTQGIIKKGGK